jgi:hypothetical protein
MEKLYGVNKTKIDAMSPSNLLSAGSSGGKVRCFVDYYVGLGTESAGDVIEMGPELPVGAKILYLAFSQTACGGTPDVGDYEDTDRYVDEATDNASMDITDTITGIGYEVDMTTPTTPDNQIIVTLDAAVTLSGVMKLVCLYTVE